MNRFNRAQAISVLIALGAGVIVFGGWVTTLGRMRVHVAVSRVLAGPPLAVRPFPAATGVSGVVAPKGFPIFGGRGLGGERVLVSPAQFLQNVHSGLPMYGLMLIFLGLIVIWAVVAVYLLRSRTADLAAHEEQQSTTV